MMKFHVSDSIHLLFLTYLVVLFHFPSISVNAFQVCYDSQNYTSGGQFETNLKRLFNSLYTKGPPTRFNTTISGEAPDRVYGLVQCDPTSSEEDCRSCVNASSIEIVRLCPNRKQAVLRKDKCYLRYSNSTFFSQVDSTPRLYAWPVRNVSDPVRFNRQLGILMDNLSTTAESSQIKYATGITNFTYFDKIYGLLQCTRDLLGKDCYSCLREIIRNIPTCCNGKAGGNVLSVSCSLRYEIYPFFEDIPPPSPTPLEASPPPPQIEGDQNTNTTKKTQGDGNKNTSKIIVSVAVPVVVGIALVSVVFTCLLWRKAVRKKDDDGHLEDVGSTDSLLINLSALKVATCNFSDANKLGEGGFGSVYKGKLPDGREIAVKRLSKRSSQGLEELRTEVLLLAKLQHRNLVRLCGCCLEEEEMLLIYDYLPNSSLDRFLFDRIKRLQLDWETRHTIIIGIARGLLYLHEDSQIRIIHRDLKVSNILLDGDMNPKISDFGLARLFNDDQTRGRTNRIAGTFGYMAPEYASHGRFSTKSDVFSFGVLVLEIVTGRKNSSFRDSEPATSLLSFAWQQWTNGRAFELLDKTVKRPCSRSEVQKCIHIGLLCVQENAMDRPTMSAVVLMLNSCSVTLAAPSRPAFILKSTTEPPRNSEGSESDQTITNSKTQSVNDVTITELEPR